MMQHVIKRPREAESENPFWISYADLMTALMVLFLVVMAVSMTSFSVRMVELSQETQQEEVVEPPMQSAQIETEEPNEMLSGVVSPEELERLTEITELCESINQEFETRFLNARVDCIGHRIHLGEAGQFARNKYVLEREGLQELQAVIPVVLEATRTELGQKWIKKVHVQGFTDPDGSYLHNLHLSLKRSEWVMCQIIQEKTGEQTLGLLQRDRVLAKQIFLVGGVSFNDLKQSKEESRRVEFKFEFYPVGESGRAISQLSESGRDLSEEFCRV